MGRSFKQRKIKHVKRAKIQRVTPTETKGAKKKAMKTWEWWLLGGAFVAAIVWLIFLANTGSMTPQLPDSTTPTAAATASR